MMKRTTMTQVTLVGVMQGDGHASDEDRRNGFERGGWARGKRDDETRVDSKDVTVQVVRPGPYAVG